MSGTSKCDSYPIHSESLRICVRVFGPVGTSPTDRLIFFLKEKEAPSPSARVCSSLFQLRRARFLSARWTTLPSLSLITTTRVILYARVVRFMGREKKLTVHPKTEASFFRSVNCSGGVGSVWGVKFGYDLIRLSSSALLRSTLIP